MIRALLLRPRHYPLAPAVVGMLLLVAATAGQAEAPEVLVLGPDKLEVTAGERVPFSVQLRAPGQFSGPTYFDLPEVPGAIVLQTSERPVLGSESQGDTTLVTASFGFALVAQRAGELTVPPITARFGTRERYDLPVKSQRLKTAPIRLDVELPPGSRDNEWVVSTESMIVEESWSAQPATARVGDAFERTLTMTAVGIPAMLLPVPDFGQPRGFSVYSEAPVVKDNNVRGESQAQRIDTVTYVCEQVGTFTIPDLAVRWWNPAKAVWEENLLHSRTVVVSPVADGNQPARESISNESPMTETQLLLAGVLVVLIVTVCWFVTVRYDLKGRWAAWKAASVTTEKAHWKDLQQACRADNPRAAYQALNRWLSHFRLSSQIILNDDAGHFDAGLEEQILALQYALIGAGSQWRSQEFSQQLASLRAEMKSLKASVHGCPLPALNPTRV